MQRNGLSVHINGEVDDFQRVAVFEIISAFSILKK